MSNHNKEIIINVDKTSFKPRFTLTGRDCSFDPASC